MIISDRMSRIFIVTALLILCITFLCVAISTEPATAYPFTVVLDAGHGGIDGGVVGRTTGVKECDLNLQVTLAAKEVLEGCGFRVVLTRSDGNGLYGSSSGGFKKRDMLRRKAVICESGADLVVSIHMNYFSLPSRSGAQVFFNEKIPESEKLAQNIQATLNALSNRQYAALKGDYFILQCADVPSVIVECGFLSNAEEERKLQEEAYQKTLAEKITEGILLYLAESAPQGLY